MFAVVEFEYSFHYPVVSITVNAGKRAFSGIYRSVDTWRMFVCVRSHMFSGVKVHVHPGLTIKHRHFTLFSRTANGGKTHCFPEFAARLAYGKHTVFSQSQKVSPAFCFVFALFACGFFFFRIFRDVEYNNIQENACFPTFTVR